MNQSIQDKEQIIVGTIINCNNEIKRLQQESSIKIMRNLSESYNADVYHYNMLNLYANIVGTDYINLMESAHNNTLQIPSAIHNVRNNYYAYFKKVSSFLNGFELNLQHSLNESISVDTKRVSNPIQINIFSFKDELKQLIETLNNQNDTENYSQQILKIKTFAKQPLFVNGYNICNNIALMRELQETFGVLYQNIIAVCFNKNTRQLYFITNNLNKLIVYDVNKDELDYYSKVNSVNVPSLQLTGSNYLQLVKEFTGINNIIELYINASILGMKFEDNLYNDAAYIKFRQKINSSGSTSSIVK